MVSTWRYHSFKGVGLSKPYTPLIIVAVGGLICAIWFHGQLVLLALMTGYVATGIVTRIAGLIRRRWRRAPEAHVV